MYVCVCGEVKCNNDDWVMTITKPKRTAFAILYMFTGILLLWTNDLGNGKNKKKKKYKTEHTNTQKEGIFDFYLASMFVDLCIYL